MRLEDFYLEAKSVLGGLGVTILDFPKFKDSIALGERVKALIFDTKVFMKDFNSFLDQLFRKLFSDLCIKAEERRKGMGCGSRPCSAPVRKSEDIANVIEDAKAKVMAMACSDDLWS